MLGGTRLKLARDVEALLAYNATPFTLWGTWTYLLGEDEITLVDPGPDDPRHLAGILAALNGRPLRQIVLTHSHKDHSGLTRALVQATGAPVLAFGDRIAGQSAAMAELVARGGLGQGGGVDVDFAPDVTLADDATLTVEGRPYRVLHTPGHMCNHIALLAKDFAITGDTVLGYASTYVSPPEGDLAQFRASCAALKATGLKRFFPGHGAVIEDAPARIDWLLAHRARREAQVLAALTKPVTLNDLTPLVYRDLAPAAWPAAERNLIAHLVDLWFRDLVTASPEPAVSAIWQAR